MKFLNHLDVNENQVKKSKLYLTTAAAYTPSGGEGNLIYDTSDDILKYWDGSNWISLNTGTATGNTYQIHTYAPGGYNNQVGLRLLGTSPATTDEVIIIGTNLQTKITNQASPNGIIVGLPDDVQIDGTLTVGDGTLTGNTHIKGNLIVDGTTTTVNSNTVSIGDNIIVLNADATGSATQDAGIEIERGSDPNVFLQYDETNNYWEFTNDGTNWCQIPCSSSGTVLSYLKHYADDGTSVVPANATDNIKFVGGCSLKTETTGSSSSSSGFDEILIEHDVTAGGMVNHETYDSVITSPVQLAYGGTFDAVSKSFFDACGHRTHRTIQRFKMPDAVQGNVDQNVFDRFLAQNILTPGASLTSAAGGFQIADNTQDTIFFRGLDTSIKLDTASDDILTLKAAVKCNYAIIDKDSLVSERKYATINHALNTDKLIVELWDMDDAGNAINKVEADVRQTNFAGTASNNHVTVQFSEIPSTDIMVVIHANNNADQVTTTPQYS